MAWECKINIKNCLGCGICVDVCPYEAIKITIEMSYPEPIQNKCEGCNKCIDECPFNAIEVIELRAEEI